MTCLKKSVIALAVAGGALAVLVACGGDAEVIEITQGTVIRNATVVNTRDGALTNGMNIIIADGKITRVTSIEVLASGTAQQVDAAGKFIVPGFNDMHAHVMDGATQTPTYWPLLIANGVTGVREMSGSEALIPQVRQLNRDRAAGLVDSPEILQVHGGFPTAPTTAAAGIAFVDQKKAAGADFIKVTAGSRDFLLAAIDQANKQKLDFTGHLGTAVSTVDSSNAGWDVIEHLGAGWGLLLDCASNETALRQSALVNSFAPPFPPNFTDNPRLFDINKNAPTYNGILSSFSESKCNDLAKSFVKNNTWNVPTLIRLRTQNFSDSAFFRNHPNNKYLDKARRARWEQMAKDFEATVPAANAKTLRDFYELEKRVTKLLKVNGAKMMAGSDSAVVAIWTVPGFSLQQEFGELAAAGLSPLEILQMTTLTPAEYLGREASMGTVEAGKNADLVMLDANPLTDAANLGKISSVFLRGKYFSRTALDKMLGDVAAAYIAQPLSASLGRTDPNHVH